MENCEVKLFIAVLEKLPPSCRLYVGGGIDSAWKDGFLQELRRYESVSYTHLTLPTTPYV